MRSAIVAIYNIFFACLVFWGISCGQSNTPSPETDPNDSVTDLHVDQLNTGNVEQIALSVLTNGYYNQYWSGLTYTPKIPGSTIGGTIIEYLNVSTANYTANQGTWVVQDLGLNTSTLLEVIDTDTAYPKVAVKSNVTTLSSADFTFVKQKSSAGVTYYCTNACAACYNSTTGVSNNPNVTCSNSTQKIGFWVKYTDTTNTTHAYLNWIPLDTSYAQPYMDNLSGSLTYISSNYNSNNGFGIVNLDVNSDASFGPSGMNFNNTATRSVSVLIRIEDCTNEDAITLNSGTWTINGTSVNIGNTQYATYTTWSSLVSEDYASFTVDTAGSNNKYCDTKFFFKGNASGVVGNLLQNLQYKNTATSGNAIEGRRTIHVFLRREDSNNSYAYVSKPETIEVDVWNPPVLTETTPVTTPTLDSTPSITLTSTKAGTISFTGGCSSDTTTLIVGSNTIDLAADTNGSGLSDGTYSCTVQLTETETGASLTSNVLTLTTFVVDTTAPQISITTDIGNANGYVNSLTPSIVLESDEAGDVVLANCSNTASMTNQTVTVRANNTVTFDTLGNGTTYAGCEITVVDSVGNTSSAVIAATFTVDATAPTISLSPSTAFSTQDTTPDVVLTSDEAGSISFTNCSSTTTSIFATANTITLRASGGGAFSEGTYSTCSMTVTDIANNTSSITVPSMSIDLTGPTISIATQVTSPTNDSTPSFSLTSNEIGTATISGDCSGSSAVTASTQTISIDTLTDGVYSNCTVFVTDRAGNTSTIRSLTSFTVDLTPPSVPVVTAITTDTTVFSLAGVDAITNIANVEFQGTTDAGTSLVVSITNTSNTTLTCSVSSANTSAGSWLCNKTTSAGDTYSANLAGGIYTISAVATDSAGNTRSTNSVFTLKVDTTVPTISETTAVAANASPANRSSDPTPDVVLTPSEAGVLTLGGNCYNSANSVLGSVANTITLYYTTGGGFPDNNTTGYTCTVRVTDAAGNISTPALSLTTFKVLVGAPTLTEVVATNRSFINR
jgi:hypothetical protein